MTKDGSSGVCVRLEEGVGVGESLALGVAAGFSVSFWGRSLVSLEGASFSGVSLAGGLEGTTLTGAGAGLEAGFAGTGLAFGFGLGVDFEEVFEREGCTSSSSALEDLERFELSLVCSAGPCCEDSREKMHKPTVNVRRDDTWVHYQSRGVLQDTREPPRE